MKAFKEIFVPAIVLFVTALVATALLALTNDVTAPKIAELAAQAEINARKQVYCEAASFGEASVPAGYEDCSVIPALNEGGEVIGYIAVTTAKGYGGDISVMTGVDVSGKVKGVSILEINETAGLGMNAGEESFLSEYLGLTAGITVSKDKPGENSVDAITGATITTRAVTRAVNLAIELAGGESNG